MTFSYKKWSELARSERARLERPIGVAKNGTLELLTYESRALRKKCAKNAPDKS